MVGSNKDQRRGVAMFRLDYLSCFLTVVATVLVGRKMWTGLVVSGVNSLIVCVIGLHTSQYGFIPANVFCICINAFNLGAWLKVQKDPSESTTDASSELLTGCKRMSTPKKGSHATRNKIFQNPQRWKARNSISSLDAKGVWPFASTQTSGVPTLDAVSPRHRGSPQISTVLSRFPSHQSYFRITRDPEVEPLRASSRPFRLDKSRFRKTAVRKRRAALTRKPFFVPRRVKLFMQHGCST
jgi:hypothetical protein